MHSKVLSLILNITDAHFNMSLVEINIPTYAVFCRLGSTKFIY